MTWLVSKVTGNMINHSFHGHVSLVSMTSHVVNYTHEYILYTENINGLYLLKLYMFLHYSTSAGILYVQPL